MRSLAQLLMVVTALALSALESRAAEESIQRIETRPGVTQPAR